MKGSTAKIILCFFAIFLSCKGNSYKVKYGSAFNPVRVKRGLPPLLENWRGCSNGVDENGFMYIQWWKGYALDKYPCLYMKTLVFNKIEPIYEENIYIGKNTYTTVDGTFNEELYIQLNFLDVNSKGYLQKKGWVCKINNINNVCFSEKGKISLDAADSILREWGLKK